MLSVVILMDLSAMRSSRGKGVTEVGKERRTTEIFQSSGENFRSFR